MEQYFVAEPHFSVSRIFASGQCFRMSPLGENRFEVIAAGDYLIVEERPDGHIFYCSYKEFESRWRQYFDLEENYGKYIEAADPNDGYLAAALRFGDGVRILRQDLWEMIITFIISSQNNIPRIRKLVDALCSRYGEEKYNRSGGKYRSFPTVGQLAQADEEELRSMKFGYRSRYIVQTAKMVHDRQVDLETLSGLDDTVCMKELVRLPGVGKKVAECIRLFGMHRLDAFPLDTHMLQMLEREYKGHFPFERYRGFNGVMQQYIFYYEVFGRKEEANE